MPLGPLAGLRDWRSGILHPPPRAWIPLRLFFVAVYVLVVLEVGMVLGAVR